MIEETHITNNKNYGSVRVVDDEEKWKFHYIINRELGRVDFYKGENYVFALVRWRHLDNRIGYDSSKEQDMRSFWMNGTMPGELMATAIHILYNREHVVGDG